MRADLFNLPSLWDLLAWKVAAAAEEHLRRFRQARRGSDPQNLRSPQGNAAVGHTTFQISRAKVVSQRQSCRPECLWLFLCAGPLRVHSAGGVHELEDPDVRDLMRDFDVCKDTQGTFLVLEKLSCRMRVSNRSGFRSTSIFRSKYPAFFNVRLHKT